MTIPLFDPKPGDRCNWTIHTDVKPCTVISRTPKTVKVRIDKAVIVEPPEMVPGGFAAVVTKPAKYEIQEDPDGSVEVFGLRNNNRWTLAGHRGPGNYLQQGWRYHYDYGF